MTEYMHLTGTDDVRRAANQMQDAADTFSRAVGSLDEVMHRHWQMLNELVSRLEALHAKASEPESEAIQHTRQEALEDAATPASTRSPSTPGPEEAPE